MTACSASDGVEPASPLDLGDRLLWPDGDVTVTPDQVASFILRLQGRLEHLTVTEVDPEVVRYNRFAERPLVVKTAVTPNLFPPRWNLPDRYKYLGLEELFLELHGRIEQDELYERRVARLAHEVKLFTELDLGDVLRTLAYVVDTLRASGTVYGVGRGSSCSSYLLYLLELHDVDPVRYEIAIEDFLRA